MRFGGQDAPEPIPPQTKNKPVLIKAVHYFSSSWPKTFWGDLEYSQVDDDFAQIKADGFNTVILVIPWMGFETGFEDGVSEPSVSRIALTRKSGPATINFAAIYLLTVHSENSGSTTCRGLINVSTRTANLSGLPFSPGRIFSVPM